MSRQRLFRGLFKAVEFVGGSGMRVLVPVGGRASPLPAAVSQKPASTRVGLRGAMSDSLEERPGRT